MKKSLILKLFIALVLVSLTTTAAIAINNSNKMPINSSVITKTETDPIETITDNVKLMRHGVKVSQLNEDTKITKEKAISLAQKEEGDLVKGATKITAVKCRFTDTANVSSKLPGKDINFKDYPVWVVTFYGVTLQSQGPFQPNGLKRDFPADLNIIIDANTGEELEGIAYEVN